MNWKTTLVVCLLILAIAAGVTTVIFQTEPTAQRSSASKRTAMLVDVVRLERGSYRPEITAMGTVRAEKEIVLSPRVGGEIIEISEHFTPGGFVEKDDILLQIDPADYEVGLLQRESELRQATPRPPFVVRASTWNARGYGRLSQRTSSAAMHISVHRSQPENLSAGWSVSSHTGWKRPYP